MEIKRDDTYNGDFGPGNPDPGPGPYFVSAVDGLKWWPMAGPYETHSAALADVGKVKRICCEHDRRALFMGWGTCRIEGGDNLAGKLNRLGLI